jgi:hypothetical protein
MASFAIACLHVGIAVAGEPAYVYFTAPERLVVLARDGSLVAPLVTGVMAAGFTFFGACALAAARRDAWPGLRILLVGITGIYLLRGALIVPEAVVVQHAGYPPRMLAFSLVAFLVGLVYATGLARAWRRLGRP